MNIQNVINRFQISEKEAYPGAEARFFQICSFDLAEAGQRKMEDSAFAVREHLRAQMDIRGAVRFFLEPTLQGDALQLGPASVRCSAFSRIPPHAIKGAFVYLVTIGETDVEAEASIMTELYHDIWGTAYIESALEVLRNNYLTKQLKEGNFLSEPFGPGYYGMHMEEGHKLFRLLEHTDIGVIRKKSGLFIPEKTCFGLMLIYDRDDIKMPGSCEKCLGTKGSCNFCDKRNVKVLA